MDPFTVISAVVIFFALLWLWAQVQNQEDEIEELKEEVVALMKKGDQDDI